MTKPTASPAVRVRDSIHSFRQQLKPQTPKGFTLIELLIVVAILAILSVIGLVTFTRAQISTRNARRVADLRSISSALELYNTTGGGGGKYPTLGSSGAPVNVTALDTFLAPTYLPQGIPNDPQSTKNYTIFSADLEYRVCVPKDNFEGQPPTPGNANMPVMNYPTTGGTAFCLFNQQ